MRFLAGENEKGNNFLAKGKNTTKSAEAKGDEGTEGKSLTRFDAQATKPANQKVRLRQTDHGLHAKDKQLAVVKSFVNVGIRHVFVQWCVGSPCSVNKLSEDL